MHLATRGSRQHWQKLVADFHSPSSTPHTAKPRCSWGKGQSRLGVAERDQIHQLSRWEPTIFCLRTGRYGLKTTATNKQKQKKQPPTWKGWGSVIQLPANVTRRNRPQFTFYKPISLASGSPDHWNSPPNQTLRTRQWPPKGGPVRLETVF